MVVGHFANYRIRQAGSAKAATESRPAGPILIGALRTFAALLVVLLGMARATSDEAWPARQVRVIVPFAAGSLVDIVPRIIFNELSIAFHQTFVVENRSGAGSTIGAAVVARSAPDGYTILANGAGQTIVPFLYKDLRFDARRDFVAVAPLAAYANVLVVSPVKGVKNLRQFVDWAQAKRGALTVAGQVGAALYMSAERFNRSAGIEATHVPFRGAAAAISEVVAGRVDYCFCGIGTALPYIRSGKLLALAVSTARRAPSLLDTPTTLEAGFADSDYTPWLGLFAPARTPPGVIQKINDAVRNAEQTPAVRAKFDRLALMPMTMSPDEFDTFVRREMALNSSLIKGFGLAH